MDATLLNRAFEWAYSWQFGQTTERQVELVGIPYDVSIARADELIVDDDVASIYEPIVDWLDPVDVASLPVPAPDTTRAMRQELSFTDGTGEGTIGDIGDLFVRTRDTETAERDRTMLVLGRKGTGKTTIFLHLLASADAVAITEPESVAASAWRPISDTWSAIADIPNGLRVAWPDPHIDAAARRRPYHGRHPPRCRRMANRGTSNGGSCIGSSSAQLRRRPRCVSRGPRLARSDKSGPDQPAAHRV